MYKLLAALFLLAFASACSDDTTTAPADVIEANAGTVTPADDTTDKTDTEVCVPDCDDKICGDDGCGSSCGECDGCDGPDNSLCEAGQCSSPCCPNCEEKTCGDDGCGGSCGDCAEDQTCSEEAGECTATCTPECEEKNCGSDGCGGSCGDCADHEICSTSNVCVCIPECNDKVCGSDGCGENCGECAENEACSDDGLCVCVPQCDDKECGDDGCGNTCGDCADNAVCDENATCVCVPDCNGKQCGGDGCGDLCGVCPAGVTCEVEGVCAGTEPILTCVGAMDCLTQAATDCDADPTLCALECLADPVCSSACFAIADVEEDLNALDACVAQSCPEVDLSCLANTCPEPAEACLDCDPTALTDFDSILIITSLQVGDGGQPGEALNIDPENGTNDCTPNNNCTEGLDNQLTTLGGLGINDALDSGIANQSLVLLAEIPENTDEPFDLYLYSGNPDNPGCDPQTSTCDFWVFPDAFTPLCTPLVVLHDAVLDGEQLVAGGDDSVIVLPLALEGDATLYLTLYRSRLEATAIQSENGYTLLESVLGGAIRKNDLLDAIDAYPGDNIAGIGKGTASLLLSFISSDVDTDEDGNNDALSVGLKATAKPANLLGVQ